MAELVDIYVVDSTPQKNPLEGVTVKITSEDGQTIYAQPVTDVDGLVEQLLPVGTYQVRLFKVGVTFTASRIEVLAAPELNNFEMAGEVYYYPQSTDPRICIASGFFRTPTGGLARGVDIHFIAKWDPIMLDGSAIMPERVTVRSNQRGYAEVPLIRFGQYDVTIEGMEDYQRTVSVPDAPAVNISDLIFPVVSLVTFDEVGPHSTPAGTPLELTPHVFSSDLNEIDNIIRDVIWTPSDAALCSVSVTATGLSFLSNTPGTYTLNAARKDQSIIRIPNTPIQGVPLTIDVT